MEVLPEFWPQLALAAGLGWASGLRLYLVLFVVGMLGRYGGVELPAELQLLSSPMVLAASGLMLLVEFFADKIPLLDSLWDTLHTFIRIPGGALLAASMMGDTSQGAALAAAILGGSLAASSHFTKAGARAVINTSPEPLSNWAASISEEGMTLAGIWLAFKHPLVLVVLLVFFLMAAAWFMRRLWRAMRALVLRWHSHNERKP